MPKKYYSDAEYAALLNARPPGRLPSRGKSGKVMLRGVEVADPTGKLLDNLRNHGRVTLPEKVLIDALAQHGEYFYFKGAKDKKGMWKLQPSGKLVRWRASDYAALLDARPPLATYPICTKGTR